MSHIESLVEDAITHVSQMIGKLNLIGKTTSARDERLRQLITPEQIGLLRNYADNLYDAGYYTQAGYLHSFAGKCAELISD